MPRIAKVEKGASDLRLAAIDVGTNSIHMIIAQVDRDGGVTTLWRMKEMVGLGRSSFPMHRLSEEAMNRGIQAMRRLVTHARRRGCEKVVAVATSAVREAENGGDFIERGRAEAGIAVRVVSARDEARLIYRGVAHAVKFAGRLRLIVDIGGGSVELIVADGGDPLVLESRKLGAARMTARFVRSDPPAKKQVQAMQAFYASELGPLLKQIKGLDIQSVIGTSGTLENLAMMCRNGRVMPEGEALQIEREALDDLVKRLVKSEAVDRVKMKGLDEKRQDQVTAGALLAQHIMKALGVKRMTICNAALREGILLDYVSRHLPDLAIRRRVPDPRRRSVMDLARKCEWNEVHSMHVAMITLRLFDELAKLHGLKSDARELVEYAAMLHDIGWHISSTGHHKHSMYLIRHGDLKGFSVREVEVIANLARYHRRSPPQPTHEFYVALTSAERRIVDVGASLLRIADGLDRSHGRVVQELSCDVKRRRVQVKLVGRGDLELELWAARRKTDMFVQVFGRAMSFVKSNGRGG